MKDLSLEESLNLDIDQNLTFFWVQAVSYMVRPPGWDNQEQKGLAQQVLLPQAPAEWWPLEDRRRAQEKHD